MDGRIRYFRMAAIWLCALLIMALTQGCSDNNGHQKSIATVSIAAERNTLVVGETLQLNMRIVYTDGSIDTTGAFTWASSAPDIASVTSDGLVTALHDGAVVISASLRGVVSNQLAFVVEPKCEEPALILTGPEGGAMVESQTFQMAAEGRCKDGTAFVANNIVWASSDANIASVSNAGLVSALAMGNVTITATAGSVSGDTAIVVTPKCEQPTLVVTGPQGDTLLAGQTFQLAATGRCKDGTTFVANNISWGSNNVSVSAVNDAGLVTGLQVGQATITATSGAASGTRAITVLIAAGCDNPTISLTAPVDNTLFVNDNYRYLASGNCANGMTFTPPDLVWQSSNDGVASIDAMGAVSAISPGQVTISAASHGVSASSGLTVLEVPSGQLTLVISSAVDYAFPVDFCPGKTVPLHAIFVRADGTKQDVTQSAIWRSASALATVSMEGVVTASATGSASIQASYARQTQAIALPISSCGISIFVKKVASWPTTYLYAWDDSITPSMELAGAWPGSKMTADDDVWLVYKMPDAKRANVVINAGLGGDQTINYLKRTASSWCVLTPKGKQSTCQWFDRDPRLPEPLALTLSPVGKEFSNSITVSVKWAGLNAQCRYTLDDSDPNGDAGKPCVHELQLGETSTIGTSIVVRACAADGVDKICKREVYQKTGQAAFNWNNATTYFVLIDRFNNADPSNDNAYGRERDQQGNVYAGFKTRQGTFHGGDLKGITEKINSGYLSDLGVTTLLINAPYEQIHGWVAGQGFKYYGYHGYWPLDFTEVDANFGSAQDLKAMVDAAHAKKIRVVMDVVMNHVGYETMKDMVEFNFGKLAIGWESYYYRNSEDGIDPFNSQRYIIIDPAYKADWARWWGAQWIRKQTNGVAFPGYPSLGNTVELGLMQFDLPDNITESVQEVELPPIMLNKWSAMKLAAEQASLDEYFSRTGKPRTVRNYLVHWLTDWVRNYGIDGFRTDTVKNVDPASWEALKAEAVDALHDWKSAHAAEALDSSPFWLLGEWGHGVIPTDDSGAIYFDRGFDATIDYGLQKAVSLAVADPAMIEPTYSGISQAVQNNANLMSFISSHDSGLFQQGDLDRLAKFNDAGTLLLLSPGAVQIFYGDETARPPGAAAWGDQGSRSDMNWDQNPEVLAHWQKLGRFRQAHPAVGAGIHKKLGDKPYTFSRMSDDDRVVVALGAAGLTTINVSSVFAESSVVVDDYTQHVATVHDGKVTFDADPSGVILICRQPAVQ